MAEKQQTSPSTTEPSDELQTRLFSNLDRIDKNVAITSLALFSLSLLFLSFLFNVVQEVKLPFNITLKEEYPFYVACPILLLVFQYIVVGSFGICRIEDQLAQLPSSLDPQADYVRHPTLFTLLFMARAFLSSQRHKAQENPGKRHPFLCLFTWLYRLHLLVVFLFYFMMPILVSVLVCCWLSSHHHWIWMSLAIGCTFALTVDMVAFAGASLRRLNRHDTDARNQAAAFVQRPESTAAPEETGTDVLQPVDAHCLRNVPAGPQAGFRPDLHRAQPVEQKTPCPDRSVSESQVNTAHKQEKAGEEQITGVSAQAKIDILLKEYDSLRGEIVSRLTSRFAIMGFLVALVTFVGSHSDISLALRITVAIVALLVSICVWFRLGQLIKRSSTRLATIETRINAMAGEELLVWESQVAKRGFFHLIYRK